MSTLLVRPAATGLVREGDQMQGLAEVLPFDASMYDEAGLTALTARAGGVFTGLDGHTRLRILALARPFSAAPAIRHLQDLRRACRPDEDWRQSGLAALQAFLELLVRTADLRSTQYFLLVHARVEQPPSAVFAAAEDGFLAPVLPLDDLPPFFGDCQEHWDHLAPREPGAPYMAVYGAYEFIGHWTLTTIYRLLRMPFPLALAIDVETLGPDKAQFQLHNAYNGLYTQLTQRSKFGGKDPRSEVAFADVQRAMAAVEAGERIHKTRLVLLIKAPTASKLATHGAYLVSALAPYLRLRLLHGQQAEALKFFTTTPPAAIHVDLRPWPITSQGAGLLIPVGLPSRTNTRGVLFGIDKSTGNPVFHEWRMGGGEGARPFHATFFGFLGSGKTFALLLLLYRLCLTGTQVILLEPMSHGRRLAAALGGGASYNAIAYETASLNLLDIVQPTLTDQINHVKHMLALALACEASKGAETADTSKFNFSIDQSIALGQALMAIYVPLWEHRSRLTLVEMPRLADLCDQLDGLQDAQGTPDPVAGDLARSLRGLYVTGEKASSFNRPTSLDLRFSRPCTVFDVKRIDPWYRTLYYMQIAVLLRLYINDPTRTQGLVLALDEFRYLAADPTLVRVVHDLVKTARTRKVAVWTIDQNPGTYMQSEEGRQIVSLSSLVFIGKQQATDVDLHRQLFPRLTAHHLHQIVTIQRGQFVSKLDDDYYVLRIEPSPVELAAFRGT